MLLFLLAACPATGLPENQNKETPAKTERYPLIKYTAPFRQIIVTSDFTLADTEERAEYDNPVAAEPSRTSKTERNVQVAEKDVAKLLSFIRERKFDQLKDAYGAKPEERNYPHSISIHDGTWKKEVICRTSPIAEACPELFSAVEKKIIEFANKAVQLNLGEDK
jgi:hypothetical protein